jgi:hypothetical protein
MKKFFYRHHLTLNYYLNDYPKAEEESVSDYWSEGLPIENEDHHK